tara:strand:+ start:60 stop:302 length:243 start_codon:yes stop_codon:yes gene_type:complete
VVEEKWVQKKEELERKIRKNKLNSVPKHAESMSWRNLARRSCATAKPYLPHKFSATLQSFLPLKLNPLGLSLNGQLKVAF